MVPFTRNVPCKIVHIKNINMIIKYNTKLCYIMIIVNIIKKGRNSN